MKIKETYPPNYQFIQMYLNVHAGKPAFPYGDTIYNPFKQEIPADVEYHEIVHRAQQEREGGAEVWWNRYCVDYGFRLEQEIEAYARQYKFIKKSLGDKIAKEALDGLVEDMLSPVYGFDITRSEAETAIRKYPQDELDND